MTFENFAFSQRAPEATKCTMIPKQTQSKVTVLLLTLFPLKQAMTFENFTFSQRAPEATECTIIQKKETEPKGTEQCDSFVALFCLFKTKP